MSLFDEDHELFVAVLLYADGVPLGQYAARGAHLDHVRPCFTW
jgi:hypothetical protein